MNATASGANALSSADQGRGKLRCAVTPEADDTGTLLAIVRPGLWVRNCCTGRELARRYCHDLDLVVRRRQFGLNGRPRRCIARRHPSVPDGVYLSEIRHVGDPDIG